MSASITIKCMDCDEECEPFCWDNLLRDCLINEEYVNKNLKEDIASSLYALVNFIRKHNVHRIIVYNHDTDDPEEDWKPRPKVKK